MAIEPAEQQRLRINKREFIARVAKRSGMSVRSASKLYETLLDELLGAASRGETVVLTGFGRFYRQDHKGHKVRFGEDRVDDYSVLKFSASRSINRKLDDEAADESTDGEQVWMLEDDSEDHAQPATAGA